MDPLYLLLGLLILALVVGGPLLRRSTARRAAASGNRAGQRFAADKLAATLAEFGATLVVKASAELTREILIEAITTPRKEYSALDDGAYGIRFVDADDAVVGLYDDLEATRLVIESFREYMGFPQTAPLWKELRSRVTAAANARGIAVSAGPTTTYTRGSLIDDRNARWTRTA